MTTETTSGIFTSDRDGNTVLLGEYRYESDIPDATPIEKAARLAADLESMLEPFLEKRRAPFLEPAEASKADIVCRVREFRQTYGAEHGAELITLIVAAYQEANR